MIIRTLFAAGLVGLAYACAGAPPTGGAGYGAFKRPDTAAGYSHFLIGRFAALTNDPREAAASYAAAMESLPGDRSLAERAVFAALLADDFPRAVEAAKALPLADDAGASLARLTLGAERLRRGDAATALGVLDGGDLGPFNRLVAGQMAAWAALETGGLDAARRRALDARAGDDLLDGVALNMVAFLELAAEEDEAALATFAAVWEEGARIAVAAEAYGRLLAASGRREAALDVLETFQAEVGSNPAVQALAGRIRTGGEIEIRRPSAREGAALAVYAPAAALAAQTEGDLAGVYFALALALDPDLHVARTLWGKALDEAGRRADAIDVLDRVPQGSPFYATAQGQLAWALRREGRDEEALKTAGEALANTSDRDLKVQLGDLMRSVQRYEEAEAIFDEIIAADAEAGRVDWRLLFARGSTRERTGDWAGAEADLRAALDAEPNSPAVLNYLGYGLVDRGEKLDEALELVRKAVRLRPQSGQYMDSLGWAYFRLGRYEEAVRRLERAVELEPGDPILNDHLGDAYWKSGRRLEARYQWRRALDQTEADAERARLETKLASGLENGGGELADAGRAQGPGGR